MKEGGGHKHDMDGDTDRTGTGTGTQSRSHDIDTDISTTRFDNRCYSYLPGVTFRQLRLTTPKETTQVRT